MDDQEFWLRCVNARCIVVPVPTYSQYGEDGNTHQEHFIGIRYATFAFDERAVGPDYWVMIEEGQNGAEHLYSTPDEALAAREARKE